MLDTETTGINGSDEIVQIGVIDLRGEVLLDLLIRPTRRTRISASATAVHRITWPLLLGKPTFADIAPLLWKALKGRTVITYNAAFDSRLLSQSASAADVAIPHFHWDCAMVKYAQFVGDWDPYSNDYRWKKLTGGDHTALGDCRATLACIEQMAENSPPFVKNDTSRVNRGRDVTLTREQFAAAQVSLDNCMQCPRVKGEFEYGSWRYFRYEGALTVLCPDCFWKLTGDRARPIEVLAFFEKVSELCAYPTWEDAYKPAERIPLDWIEFALSNLRDMTSDDLGMAENDCHREPPEGQPDQRRQPMDAKKVLRCLRYIKEASEGTITKMFRMWDRVDDLITEWMVGEPYDPYRRRVKEAACGEFLFGVTLCANDV
ncbi:MAG: exonuclease domain-containing protein [Planctomycetota bacterium]